MSKMALAGFICAFVALSADLVDDKWPQFRGPGGLGLGTDKVTLPSEFGRGKLADLVALLSGRNFETKQFEDAIAETSFAKLKKGVLAFISKTHFDRITMTGAVDLSGTTVTFTGTAPAPLP